MQTKKLLLCVYILTYLDSYLRNLLCLPHLTANVYRLHSHVMECKIHSQIYCQPVKKMLKLEGGGIMVWVVAQEQHSPRLLLDESVHNCLLQFSQVVESRMVFDEMLERDGFAWSTMISAYVRGGDLNSARKVFDEMPEKNTATWNTIIHGHGEAGDVESAEELFHRMLKRDVISWTTMINCYCKNKRYREALELFDEMKRNGTRPDDVTIATVISACAHLGALDKEEALAMFDNMEKEKIEPNRVVFVSVLAACTHAGMVEEGKRRFLEMTSKYSILPEVEHYGCMVDLLCRVGLLEEALGLIRSMRMQPNAVVWGALLSGCKLHNNLEIAKVAVDRLTILEPNNSGYYTLLSNMFAEANRWSEVAQIRAMMRDHGVEKIWPGSSWIEVKKKMHQFAACDNYHPASKEIYSVLELLDSQLKLFGHAPYLDFVVQENCGS